MKDRPERLGRLKIGVFGPYHVGKSSFIRSIDPAARHIEACTPDGDHTTIAIDFGRTNIGERQVYLFGTPGQEQFRFVRELISRGLAGGLLLIDPNTGLKSMHIDIQGHLQKKGVPIAFLINKCDEFSSNHKLLDILKGVPVHEISALDPVSCRQALESFVRTITSTST